MQRSAAIVVGVALGLALGLASCGAPPKQQSAQPCEASTCAGCCDARGECLSGTAVFECGVGGVACRVCAVNELCAAGACQRFDGGGYDASVPMARDAGVNADAGTFDAGPPLADAGGAPDAVGLDAGGVRDGGATSDGGPPVSFVTDVVPVLLSCDGCHLRSTYRAARDRVVPFDPNASLLYQRITGLSGNPMPPGGPLSNTDPAGTERIRRWILQGALNN
ncbi:MAG: hypothetical protein INH41_24775 [Myxococcaceae bacterium]|nr:hypothetical protein [Myxococcaceae bacterium]MCA3015615.1 hypothetical protein [Myxococcaceae bacterium]